MIKNATNPFKEKIKENEKTPYSYRRYNTAILGPSSPHYSPSIEINIYENTAFDAYLDGKHYTLSGNSLIFIPPDIVHAFSYHHDTNGFCYALKLHTGMLRPVFDVQNFLKSLGTELAALPFCIPLDPSLLSAAKEFDSSEKNFGDMLSFLVKTLQTIAPAHDVSPYTSKDISNDLNAIITWSEQSFARKISLADISSKFGYNKNYFCRMFKNSTGMTYISYLNDLRINYAKKLLAHGHDIKRTCIECGFDDVSYFTQLFKKITGTTPKKYLIEHKNDRPSN